AVTDDEMTALSDDELDQQNAKPLPARESVSLSVQGAVATVSDPPETEDQRAGPPVSR
ncbi:MAG: hypothetical protein QOJ52_2268, partial [Acidimicrobiaceae bacterium]|nr:hypothetical protein [Acidimicrobiaceae bacterium]